MQSAVLTSAALSACFLLVHAPLRAEPDKPVNWSAMREVTTDEQLQNQANASKPLMTQLAGMKLPLETSRPASGHSLYTKSIILFDGESHTLIPIGSVLHLPPNLRNRVIASPKGDFTFWPNFLRKNSSWLGAKEVSLKMAKGDAKLAEITLQELVGSPLLVVSVYRECPISVLEAAPAATASTQKP